MSKFLEETYIKTCSSFYTYSFTKQSFVHDMEPYVSISKQIFGGECYE